MARLNDKLAIITGAARGIGAAIARQFVAEGAWVILTDILDNVGEALADELGEGCCYRHLDVADEAQWQSLLAYAADLGEVQVLVNNAAILHTASIAETSRADYMRVVEVNQLGSFLGIRAVAGTMRRAGGGSIINVSSIEGLQAKNGLAAYCSSKWALRGLTKTAALELGPDRIRVNSLHPGGIYTAMHGASGEAPPNARINDFYRHQALPRVGTAQEVAHLALFLASDESSYCTGAEFLVDGGWQAGMRVSALPGA